MFSDQPEYYDHKFMHLIHENQIIEAMEFHDCVFIHCSFRESTFKRCKFTNCRFEECNLSLAMFDETVISRAHFQNSQMVGVNWARADWSGRSLIKPFDFHQCVLNYSIFMGLELKEVELVGCLAKEVDFSDANLASSDCSDTDFSGSRFSNTDLTEADFSQATNYQIDATQNTLKKTRFSLPEAISLLRSLDIELVE